MTVARRRLLQALTVAGSLRTAADAQDSKLGLDALRSVSLLHGANLSDDRLEVVKPVLESRLAKLQALRSFEVDDAVGPTQGILTK